MHMAKRSPRLLFTEEELETPELQKPVRKAEKAAKKLEKAESRIPKKKIVQKQRVYDPKENQVVTRLSISAECGFGSIPPGTARGCG
jgi:hypothetical protein